MYVLCVCLHISYVVSLNFVPILDSCGQLRCDDCCALYEFRSFRFAVLTGSSYRCEMFRLFVPLSEFT